MNVMWRFVEVQDVNRDDLRQWWLHHYLLDLGHIYWRHQWAAERPPETWTIQVLSSAIINSDLVNTSQNEKKAIRLLSNTLIASQLRQHQYNDFMVELRRSYQTLLHDDMQAFEDDLEAIQRKKYTYPCINALHLINL